MRTWRWTPLLLALVPLAAAAPAGATPFSGTLTLSISRGLGSVSFLGSGSGTSSPGMVTIPPGAFSGMTTLPITYQVPVTNVRWHVKNGALAGSGSPLLALGAVHGSFTVRGNLGNGPLTLIRVPLVVTSHGPSSVAHTAAGLGIGGSTTVYLGTGTPAGTPVPIAFLPWQVGPAKVTGSFSVSYHVPTGMMASGFVVTPVPGTASYTGTDSRTPGGRGQITLVSPTKVTVFMSTNPTLYIVLGTLTLNFVPEPGTLALLGAGVAGLGALGRRRSLARAAR